MCGERDWRDYLKDLLAAAEHVVVQTSHATDEEILDEEASLYGDVLYQLMVMGEAAKQLPTTLRGAHPELDWTGIIGMRDRIAHGYFAIVRQVLLSTVRDDLPSDVSKLRDVLLEIDEHSG